MTPFGTGDMLPSKADVRCCTRSTPSTMANTHAEGLSLHAVADTASDTRLGTTVSVDGAVSAQCDTTTALPDDVVSTGRCPPAPTCTPSARLHTTSPTQREHLVQSLAQAGILADLGLGDLSPQDLRVLLLRSPAAHRLAQQSASARTTPAFLAHG